MSDVNLNETPCEACGQTELHVIGSPFCLNRMGFDGCVSLSEIGGTLLREVASLRASLAELVAARDAEHAAARDAARARRTAFAHCPPPPKRIPRNAVAIHDLPPEEQARINAECARELAPIHEAEGTHKRATARLDAAWAAARAALSSSQNATKGGK